MTHTKTRPAAKVLPASHAAFLQVLETRARTWQDAQRAVIVSASATQAWAAKHLTAAREAAGLSLREVARQADVSATALSMLESGASSRVMGPEGILRVIAVLFGRTPTRHGGGDA